jgi:hypothetical protein
MTSLEYGRIQALHSEIYVAKRVQPSSEDIPFGFGGIHLQNIPLPTSLGGGGLSKISSTSAFSGYEVTSIGGPWVSSTTADRTLRLFRAYGCIQFLKEDLGDYNAPIYIKFKPPTSDGVQFHLVVGYAENWVYVDIMPVLGGSTATGIYPDGSTFIGRYIARYLEHRQSCREKYGTILRTERQLGRGLFVAATIHREDPRTRDGEAAGNRRHFILFVDINSTGNLLLPNLPVDTKKESSKEPTKVSLKSLGKSFSFLRD